MTILFRGLRNDGKGWVEGYYVHYKNMEGFPGLEDKHVIIWDDGVKTRASEVRPETVGHYTGLDDKNGKKIFVGDILCNDEYQTWEWRGVVKFSHGVFGAEWLSNVKSQSMVGSWGQKHNLRKLDDDIVERQIVIGNIYENHELLTKPSYDCR